MLTASAIYQLYKELCPNSTQPFEPTHENVQAWKKSIAHNSWQKMFAERNPGTRAVATAEQMQRYAELRAERTYNSVAEMPTYIQTKVANHIATITTAFPLFTQIYLSGSYVTGEYIDEQTDDEFIQLKQLIKGKSKLSDFDFVIPNQVAGFFEFIGDDIHLLYDRGDKKFLVHP